ncbi:hypothetical protein [Streptomyces tubercidicus]|uniref:hypothetical protein n=1 Tax=Streptomyces tubercidicus TaxID=47759 RepID=UPI0036861129
MASPDHKVRRAGRGSARLSGGLKALADAKKFDDSPVLGPTQKYVLDKEARDHSRRQDIIHPSEMAHADWCPRATYRRIRSIRDGGVHRKESFGFQSLSIFQNGHEMHSKWQRWLWEQGVLWGHWLCNACERKHMATSPTSCFHCGSRDIQYGEVPLDAEEEALIVGSADGGVPGHTALMEFKTVGAGTVRFEDPELLRAHTHKTVDGKTLVDYEGLWRSINRPFSSHQRQGQIYLWICALRGLNFDKVIYIYESKFNQGVKEFVVKRRESIVYDVMKLADGVKDALDGGGPVPVCPKGGCKHCDPEGEGNEAHTPRRGVRASGADSRTSRRARPGTGS